MMCMTELHGGVCHRTSTPHKSGNKMKEKKKTVVGRPIQENHACQHSVKLACRELAQT